ncbi:hypothetical protein HY989_01555 [Candidatus Micrarchaeota archaeon]|nr:hypothetical protein [Candidatus Micrarchaeota archaeon]
MEISKKLRERWELLACELIVLFFWLQTSYWRSVWPIFQYYVFEGPNIWFGKFRTVGYSLAAISKGAFLISPYLILIFPYIGLFALLALVYKIFKKSGFALAAAFAFATPLYSEFTLQPIAIATLIGFIAYEKFEKSPIQSGFLLAIATSFHLSILSIGFWFAKAKNKFAIGFLLFIALGFLVGYNHILYSIQSIRDIRAFILLHEDYASHIRSLLFSLPWILIALIAAAKSKNNGSLITICAIMLLFGLNIIVNIDRYVIPLLAFTFLTAKKGKYGDVALLSAFFAIVFMLNRLQWIRLF